MENNNVLQDKGTKAGSWGKLKKGKKQRKNEDVKQLCLVWGKKKKRLHHSSASLSFF